MKTCWKTLERNDCTMPAGYVATEENKNGFRSGDDALTALKVLQNKFRENPRSCFSGPVKRAQGRDDSCQWR